MYAYKEVSREELLFRGLAIATILALVGMAVMPAVSVGDYSAVLGWAGMQSDNPNLQMASYILGLISLGLSIASVVVSGGLSILLAYYAIAAGF